MKFFDWDQKKNELLKSNRNVSFAEVIVAISEGRLLTIVEHKNKTKYPNQKIFIVNINSYVYLVPFVQDSQKIFLKTIIPNSKATKIYILHQNEKS